MKMPAWERCQFYSDGHCPQHVVIDKAYLTPQLLEPSHLQAAIATCEDCEKHLSEKRRYPRIKRPFKVMITNHEPKRMGEGITVDISINAALVKLDQWTDFSKNEVVQLQLHSVDKDQNQTRADTTDLRGIIKRMTTERQELVIVFLKEYSVKKAANI